ncbi:MAG: serine/threonine protein kinase [Myxococcota bacterium]|jgi:serine/threonine protein kinase
MTSRICPQCRNRTEALVCSADGYPTVDASLYEGDDAALIGRTIGGRYRMDECIGRGGMGAVYRAVQLSVNRAVAIKILRPQFARNLDQVKRFQTEMRAASTLEHPHSIRVYDSGQSDDGALYMVTELLEGEPLSELLFREGRVAPERVVTVACQVLKSLSEAHARGIIHRDMKPENVFLKRVHGEDIFVKVLDFGIAKVVDATDEQRVTTTGTVVGTPLYMSPEQARGREVDHTTDLYSLGAVLWEMLAGEPPFKGDSAMAVMMAHVQAPLPPMRLDPDPLLGRGGLNKLENLVIRCMAKDPGERPQSADELRAALEECVAQGVARPTPRELARVSIPEPAPPVVAPPEVAEPRPFEVPVETDLAYEPDDLGYEPDDLTLEAFGEVRGRRTWVWVAIALLAVGAAVAWFGFRDQLWPSGDPAVVEPTPVAPNSVEPAITETDAPLERRSPAEAAPRAVAGDRTEVMPTSRRSPSSASSRPRSAAAKVAERPSEPHSGEASGIIPAGAVSPRKRPPRTTAPRPELRVKKK